MADDKESEDSKDPRQDLQEDSFLNGEEGDDDESFDDPDGFVDDIAEEGLYTSYNFLPANWLNTFTPYL